MSSVTRRWGRGGALAPLGGQGRCSGILGGAGEVLWHPKGGRGCALAGLAASTCTITTTH